jgi:hypothetical protein
MRANRIHSQSSRGFALIVLLALLTAGILYFVVGQLDSAAVQRSRDEATALVLTQAKEALIGYAASYPETHQKGSPLRTVFVPGHLPCPDLSGGIGNEGNEDPNCGAKGVTVIGMLPWKTLGLPPLKDGWGNCLWYAVSGSFKANPKDDLLNWDSLGQFQVVGADGVSVLAGASPETQPVAVVFSPGPPLPGQARTGASGECGGDYNAGHFLDSIVAGATTINNAVPNATADGITVAAAAGPAGNFNDRLLWISRDDIFARAVQKRSDINNSLAALLSATANCLAQYGISNLNHRLPWAAPMALADATPNTFANDQFADASGQLVGRVPVQVHQSFQAAGSSLPSFSACSTNGDPGCRLFRTDNCPSSWLAVAGYPTPLDGAANKDSPDGWFEKWKDHLFYAVAEDFQPSSAAPPYTCLGGHKCLYVDGVGPFAAIVLFAGPAMAVQQRAMLANKNAANNYLEGLNVTAITTNTPANPNFGQFSKTGGNDQLVCIRRDLTIDPFCMAP